MSSIVRKIISTSKAPQAIGPYSQAVQVDNTLYLSGQIGFDPATAKLVDGGVSAETKQALKNLGNVLNAAGCSFSNVKSTVLLASMDDFQTVNDIYKEFFPNTFPARAAYQVARLPRDARVEIEAVAVVGKIVESP